MIESHSTILKLMQAVFVAACVMALVMFWIRNHDATGSSSRTLPEQPQTNRTRHASIPHVHDAFPPAYIADESGNPIHSWRVLLLPYLEHQDLYDDYDFREPWNGPNNIKLLARMPREYSCPARDLAATTRPSLTSYVVVTGPGTLFQDAASTRFDQITDGTPNTLLVVETLTAKIPWTAPEDLDIRTMSLRLNETMHPSISSRHPLGANVVFADARCSHIKESITAEQLRSMITRRRRTESGRMNQPAEPALQARACALPGDYDKNAVK